MSVHKILLISTGGTIAGEVAGNRKDDGYEVKKAEHFAEFFSKALIEIHKERGVEVLVQPYEYVSVDSSDVLPEHWEGLANIVQEHYDEYDSFIITHGTNTLGYTSAALSFALLNNAKPVILTGSQVPLDVPGSDAKTNLENAIRVATWTKHEINGVVVVFGSHIISGPRVKKSTEFDYDAFISFNTGSIGRIGRIIDINEVNLAKHNSYLSTPMYPLAKTKSRLKVENRFITSIVSLTEFPGMSVHIFRNLVDTLQTKGFILRAFGAGDASTHLQEGLKFLKEEQIPIVITTQAPNGNANLQVNEPGQYIKEHDLGIPAYDMGIEAQTAKLAWLLGKIRDQELTYKGLMKQMTVDMRGEVKVMWEDEYGN